MHARAANHIEVVELEAGEGLAKLNADVDAVEKNLLINRSFQIEATFDKSLAASRLTRMKRPLIAGVAFLTSLFLFGGCQGGPDREPIVLLATAVGGGQLQFDDLGDQDTVLWFWAPW